MQYSNFKTQNSIFQTRKLADFVHFEKQKLLNRYSLHEKVGEYHSQPTQCTYQPLHVANYNEILTPAALRINTPNKLHALNK